MLILQAALVEQRLVIWAEGLPAAQDVRQVGRPRKVKEAEPPPPAGSDVLPLWATLGDARVIMPESPVTFVAWLPTVASRPAISSPLLGEVDDLAAARIEPWSVIGYPLEMDAAIQLLAAAAGKRIFSRSRAVGPTVGYFVTAMRFAATLVARGHVLPSLSDDRGNWSARWVAAPVGEERNQLASLVSAIPAAALAFGTKSDAPPNHDRRAAVEQFVDAVVDCLMRPDTAVKSPAGASLHERWVVALRSSDARVKGDSAELQAMQASLASWRRPVAEQALFDFRLAFRLEEPVGDQERWTIRFLLQSISDPSLLFPLALMWERDEGGDSAAVSRLLRRNRADAPRFVLASLAQASAISAAVDAALRSSSPSLIETDTKGAFAFLSSDGSALESAGFGVFLPSWWSSKGTKKRLTLRGSAKASKLKSKSGLSIAALTEVEWKIALGGEEISIAELRALARMKEPLVRLRGQWVQLNASEIGDAIRFAGAKMKQRLGELVRAQLSGRVEGAPLLEVESIEGSGVLGELLSSIRGEREWKEQPPPRDFHGTLRPYQARGYAWLDFLCSAGFGACLADDMGLGKTIQTLAFIQKRWDVQRGPVLLIAPTSVTGNWLREIAKFTPALPALLHHGADRRRGEEFAKQARESAIVISSYSLLTRDVELLRQVEWSGVVLDEAQNIKNAETKQSKAARSIESAFRIALTGTPVENNIGDLWSILDFLNPGFLGSVSSFRERFFIPIQTQRDQAAIDALRKLTGPFVLRRLKTDRSIISDLPEKNEMKVYCTLTKEQASLYEAVVSEAAASIEKSDGIARKGMILATLTKLKQLCNHPRQLLGDGSPVERRSGKLNRLLEMLGETLEVGDRSLVFTQFAEMGTILQSFLQEEFGVEVIFLHGGTARTKRDQMIERFQNDASGPQIFVLSLKAGGTGLNLTRANHVFHFDRWWNPAVENQATDRAFRIGQKRSVQVHKFICGGTFEEKIDAMIEGKLELATRVVGTGEGWLTELSNRDLRELFALRADAVGE